MQDKLNKEILELERQEERKYETSLRKLKQEVELTSKNKGSIMGNELQKYKADLEIEAQKKLRDHAREQQAIIDAEEDRLE